MNQIPKRDRYAEEVASIREIVEQHPLPDFVLGFDVRLGEFDGDPAVWVTFNLSHDIVAPGPELKALSGARDAVERDLLDTLEDRYPYFRFHVERDRPVSAN